MKKLSKRIVFVIIILILLISINTETLAWSQIIDDGQDFMQTGKDNAKPEDNRNMEKGLKRVSSYIYNILLVAGVVIAVIIASILGIQFMIGGAEGQAKVKEMLLPYIVGCIIVFGGFGFWKIALKIGEKLDKIGMNMTNTNIEIAECLNEQEDVKLY